MEKGVAAGLGRTNSNYDELYRLCILLQLLVRGAIKERVWPSSNNPCLWALKCGMHITFHLSWNILLFFSSVRKCRQSYKSRHSSASAPFYRLEEQIPCLPWARRKCSVWGCETWELGFLPHCPPRGCNVQVLQAAAFYRGHESGAQRVSSSPGHLPRCPGLLTVECWSRPQHAALKTPVALEASATSSLTRKHKKTQAWPNCPFDFEKWPVS